jgi:tetrapyrrole methylase family protein/MazG family protein
MITITGLGPAGYDRIPAPVRDILEDPGVTVVVRTLHHPAAQTLALTRDVDSCDDLYESAESFDALYDAIAERIASRADSDDVVYAVPGSPYIGELSVRRLLAMSDEITVVPAESFVDHVLGVAGYDPLDRGLQVLNAHQMPEPLVIDKPTIIAQLDTPESLAEVGALVDGCLPEGTEVLVITDTLSIRLQPDGIDPNLAGLRTSMFVDAEPGGLIGAIRTVRRLREECPWDREQTHQSLVKNLVEEAYELIEAIGALPEGDEIDWSAYAAVEDELGDLLLQVLMHEAIGRERGAIDINVVAEGLRQKLVRRHPHVFGDVEVSGADEVKSNWDEIKAAESPATDQSAIGGIPAGLPALQRAGKVQNRAAKVGFDWESPDQVVPKVAEELDEVVAAIGGDGSSVSDEIGDLLFSVVNLARHLGVDPELALRSSVDRFESRFRAMEAEGPLQGMSLAEMDERWMRAKGC